MNGLIIQWGTQDREKSVAYGIINLPISYTSVNTYWIFNTIKRNSVQNNASVNYPIDNKSFKFFCNDVMPCYWITIGY